MDLAVFPLFIVLCFIPAVQKANAKYILVELEDNSPSGEGGWVPEEQPAEPILSEPDSEDDGDEWEDDETPSSSSMSFRSMRSKRPKSKKSRGSSRFLDALINQKNGGGLGKLLPNFLDLNTKSHFGQMLQDLVKPSGGDDEGSHPLGQIIQDHDKPSGEDDEESTSSMSFRSMRNKNDAKRSMRSGGWDALVDKLNGRRTPSQHNAAHNDEELEDDMGGGDDLDEPDSMSFRAMRSKKPKSRRSGRRTFTFRTLGGNPSEESEESSHSFSFRKARNDKRRRRTLEDDDDIVKEAIDGVAEKKEELLEALKAAKDVSGNESEEVDEESLLKAFKAAEELREEQKKLEMKLMRSAKNLEESRAAIDQF